MVRSTDNFNLGSSDIVALIAIPAVLLGLTLVTVSLRFYARTILTKAFGADDWALLFAQASFVAYSILNIYTGVTLAKYGLAASVLTIVKLELGSILLYVLSSIAVKFAMAAFIARICMEKWQKYIIYIATGIYILCAFIYFWMTLFACGSPTVKNLIADHCVSYTRIRAPMTYVTASVNSLVNIVYVLTPCALVVKRSMPRATRIPISTLILLGLFCSTLSIVRITMLWRLTPTGNLTYFHKVAPLSLVSQSESAIGIVTVSLVTLRPLLTRWLGPVIEPAGVSPELPDYEDLASGRHLTGRSRGQSNARNALMNAISRDDKPARSQVTVSTEKEDYL